MHVYFYMYFQKKNQKRILERKFFFPNSKVGGSYTDWQSLLIVTFLVYGLFLSRIIFRDAFATIVRIKFLGWDAPEACLKGLRYVAVRKFFSKSLLQLIPGTKSAEKSFGLRWSKGMMAGYSVIFYEKLLNLIIQHLM